MSLIKTIEVDEIKFRYVKGENEYSEILENIERLNFLHEDILYEKTQVGVNFNGVTTLIVDEEKRKSKTHKYNFFIDYCFTNLLYNFLFDNNLKLYGDDKWQLLRYDKDDMFLIHKDRQINNNHEYSILLFPPKDFSHFEGGDLILLNNENETNVSLQTVFKTNNFNQWTFVIFSIDLFHYVQPILQGHRFVWKNALFNINDVDENIQDLENNDDDEYQLSYEEELENRREWELNDGYF